MYVLRGNASSPMMTYGKDGCVVFGNGDSFGMDNVPASSACPSAEFV